MAPTCQIPYELRIKIITLREEGYSIRQISKKLKFSVSGVAKTIHRYRDTGSYDDRPRSGAPRKTSQREEKFLEVISKRNRFKTVRDLTAELNTSRETPVSESTVRRRLAAKNLKGYIAAKKPLLRAINKKKRLQWAKKYQDWTEKDWEKVLFTDESKFEIFGNKRRRFVRRLPGERMKPQCIAPTVKHGGSSVMVWGCFGSNKIGDLVKVEGTMKKEDYHSILQKHAKISGLHLIGKGFVLQQDNDPKHTSKLCKNYLQSLEKKNILQNMEWPAQSPDCNPIELLWDELDRRVRKQLITSKVHLWEILQQEWKHIPIESLRKLIHRMPRVCKAVIKAKGGYFEESKI